MPLPSTQDIVNIVEKYYKKEHKWLRSEDQLNNEVVRVFKISAPQATTCIQNACHEGFLRYSKSKNASDPLVSIPLLRRENELFLHEHSDISYRIFQLLHLFNGKTKTTQKMRREELQCLAEEIIVVKGICGTTFKECFDKCLKVAIERRLIESDSEGLQCGESNRRHKMCIICSERPLLSHEKILQCDTCAFTRHASCMGLSKNRMGSMKECERCGTCRQCGEASTLASPLSYCPHCLNLSHVEGCHQRQVAESLRVLPRSPRPLVLTCLSCKKEGKKAKFEAKSREEEDDSEENRDNTLTELSICIPPSPDSTMSDKDKNRGLVDSLTRYFTPSSEGRRRMKAGNIGGTTSEEDDEDTSRHMNPLSVDIHDDSRLPTKSSPSSSGSHHRQAKLQDALSPYFSASSGKRRTVEKGDFAVMHSGGSVEHVERRRRGRPRTKDKDSNWTVSARSDDNQSDMVSPGRKSRQEKEEEKGAEWRPNGVGRNTQNSASAALFSSPEDERKKGKKKKINRLRSSSSDRSPSTKKIADRADWKKSRRRKDSDDDWSLPDNEQPKPTSMRRFDRSQPSSSSSFPQSSTAHSARKSEKLKRRKDGEAHRKKEASPVASTTTGTSSIATNGDHEWNGMTISSEKWSLFEACTNKADEKVDKVAELDKDGNISHWPLTICLGAFEMETWFTAPYPSEYAHSKRLFICEFCLKYMRTLPQLIRHSKKCEMWHPPGNEIYRKDDVSVFEVDGNIAGIYCQNLCMLAKLYLDHKTLYYDVEPFLFYVVTKRDEFGFHLVGYFSKEKYSAQRFNLSCIVTLPCYHQQGYGRFLIDFSYLLTRREGQMGTPERPLSDLGRVSYASYWKSAICEYLYEQVKNNRSFVPMDISRATGISIYDVFEVLEALGMIVKNEKAGQLDFILKVDYIEKEWKKLNSSNKRIQIDESCLNWSPTVYTPSKDFAVRSPPPVASPTPSQSTGISPSGVPVAACGSTIKRGAHAAATASNTVTKTRKAQAIRNLGREKAADKKKMQPGLAQFGFTSTPSTRRTANKVAESQESSSSSSSSDEEEEKKTKSCREGIGRGRKRETSSDSSDDGNTRTNSHSTKKTTNTRKRNSGALPTRTSNGKTQCGKGRKRAGKAESDREERDDDDLSSVPSTSEESESEEDSSFRIETKKAFARSDKKDAKGKPAPAKTKVSNAIDAAPCVAKKKNELKRPGKVFPPNYLKPQSKSEVDPSPTVPSTSSPTPILSSSPLPPLPVLTTQYPNAPSQPVSPANSMASTETIPMRVDERKDSPIGPSIEEAEDNEDLNDTDARNDGRRREKAEKERNHVDRRTDATSEEESESMSSGSEEAEKESTPQPIGDIQSRRMTVNMGGEPDEMEILERPPSLEAEVEKEEAEVGEEAVCEEEEEALPPPITAIVPQTGESTTDSEDDVPPTLSPNYRNEEEEEDVDAETEPAATQPEDKQETPRIIDKPLPPSSTLLSKRSSSSLYNDPFAQPPKAPHSVHEDIESSVGHNDVSFAISGHGLEGGISEGSGDPSSLQHTPIIYPGSTGAMQSTPSSIPSTHNTPEMMTNQQFMSPTMQMCMQQPSSVHSSHSVHDMSGGGPGSVPPGSIPSAYPPLAHSNPDSFGSPTGQNIQNGPTSVPEVRMGTPGATSGGRRSSEAASTNSSSSRGKKRSSASSIPSSSLTQSPIPSNGALSIPMSPMVMPGVAYPPYPYGSYAANWFPNAWQGTHYNMYHPMMSSKTVGMPPCQYPSPSPTVNSSRSALPSFPSIPTQWPRGHVMTGPAFPGASLASLQPESASPLIPNGGYFAPQASSFYNVSGIGRNE